MPRKKTKTKISKSDSWDFLYILIFSFIFITLTAFVANRLKKDFYLTRDDKLATLKVNQVKKIPTPVLVGNPTFPILSAQAILVTDLDSGITLFEKNPDLQLLPASTTKIVTSLVALDYYPLDKVLRVQKVAVDGQKMRLVPGEEITTEDLLYGLLVFSANDAAEVLAENFPGGRDVFIAAMNLKAKELDLASTTFTNPSGLESDKHLTSARDLIRVSKYAIQNPTFAEIVSTKEKVVKSVDGKIAHKLVNINELLGEVDGVLGVKTGWTENARENLVTYVKRGDRKIMIAVLASQDRFEETKELISWVFKNYTWESN